MPKKKTLHQFIAESTEVHDGKYDYSKSIYTNTYSKLIIICPHHGEWLVRPNDHIQKKSGCPSCAGTNKGNTSTFIQKAKSIHKDKYDYSQVQYKNAHTPLTIICKMHGHFQMSPVAHISQHQGCGICNMRAAGAARRKTTEQFINEASVIHNDKYDYSQVNYQLSNERVSIICKEHGTFLQAPTNHTHLKQGCPICWDGRRPPGVGGYHQGYFDLNPDKKQKPAIFYAIEMESLVSIDHFIKIGITTRSIKERYSKAKCGDKYLKKTIISEIQMPLYDAWQLEQQMLAELKPYQYFPNIDFDGKTECFKPKYEVLKHILCCHWPTH